MTVTDQPIATDVRCVCGDPKWDHKQGRAACKHCPCDTYDPATDHEVEKLRAEVEQLNQAITVITADRDEAVLMANQSANKNARLRRQVADLEAALVEANDARRMRDSEVLHRDLARAALTLEPSEQAYACLRCRARYQFDDAGHRCGRLIPVDVIVVRRPNPPTTEEQP